MTRTTNARVAGFTFLFYIAAGISSLVVYGKAASGEGTAAKLASIAQHLTDVRITVLLGFLQCMSALVLAVTLYAITRDEDRDLSLLGLTCRAAEGVLDAINLPRTLGLLWLAKAGAGAPDVATANTLGAFLLMPVRDTLISASFFAVGSTLFSYLLLRGRMIPAPLAWLGVLASILLLVGVPLQLAGFIEGPVAGYMWLPMLAFEVPLGLWLLVKGAATPATR